IKVSQKKRGAPVEIVDEIIQGYKDWTKIRFELDALNKKQNALQKQIGQKFKAKEDASALLAEKDQLAAEKKQLVEVEQKADADVRWKVNQVGNIVHESVVDSMDEANNEIVRTVETRELTQNDIRRGLCHRERRAQNWSHHEVLFEIGRLRP
ncbi:hypothetical protein OXX69_013732, partial [Metschnikowia pulcherrima]